jgi:hypothetical protein
MCYFVKFWCSPHLQQPQSHVYSLDLVCECDREARSVLTMILMRCGNVIMIIACKVYRRCWDTGRRPSLLNIFLSRGRRRVKAAGGPTHPDGNHFRLGGGAQSGTSMRRQAVPHDRSQCVIVGPNQAAGATDARKARLWHGPGLLSLVADRCSPRSAIAGGRAGRAGSHRQPRALGLGGAGPDTGGGQPDRRSREAVERQPAAVLISAANVKPRIQPTGSGLVAFSAR